MTDHWDRFYGSFEVPILPSQFAVFALNEQPDTQLALEFGCGNSRDAMFFAKSGIPTIGVDASTVAIEAARSRGVENLSLLDIDLDSNDLDRLVLEKIRDLDKGGPILIYARFFIHAIPESLEAKLLRLTSKILSERPGVFSAEFRTHRDEGGTKVTSSHYRRFVNPVAFMRRAQDAGLCVKYFVEGYGHAKYKEDDAHVARIILEKTDLSV